MKASDLRKKVKAAKKAAYDEWMSQYGSEFEEAAEKGKTRVVFVYKADIILSKEELAEFLAADGFTIIGISFVSDNGVRVEVSWAEEKAAKVVESDE